MTNIVPPTSLILPSMASSTRVSEFSYAASKDEQMNNQVDESIELQNVNAEQDKILKEAQGQVHDLNDIMRLASNDLRLQRSLIKELYEYDKDLNAFVHRSTGEVVAMETHAWVKRLIMSCIMATLFTIICIIILVRLCKK